MNIREYVLGDTYHCPECGSEDIEGAQMDLIGDLVYQDIKCHHCGFVWSDRYQLTGIAFNDESYLRFVVKDEVENKYHDALLHMQEGSDALEILGHTFFITVVDGVPVVLEKE